MESTYVWIMYGILVWKKGMEWFGTLVWNFMCILVGFKLVL